MKSYRNLKEDIGLSTGIGLAGIDMPLGAPVQKRRNNGYNNDISLAHRIYESLGICEYCLEPMTMNLKEGKLICKTCK